MAAHCFGRRGVVRAVGGLQLHGNLVTLSPSARSLLFTLMWAGLAAVAWLVVTHAPA
jgi:hypothetical protein